MTEMSQKNQKKIPVRRQVKNGVRPRKNGQNKNSSISSLPTAYGVQTGTNLQKGMRLKKREFITNVGHNSTGAKGHSLFRPLKNSKNGVLTSVAELAANAGLTQSFPWLSNVARFFDKFLFHQLSFEYVPSTGSTTPGTVALCPTYKADESNDGTVKSDLLDRAGSSRSATWQTNKCKIDPSKANAAFKSHFVRDGEVNDKKLTDPARLDVFIETPVANSDDELGELWVDYDVSLEVPKGITDNRAGSQIAFNLQGNAGLPKVLTFTSLPDISTLIDTKHFWTEPDPTNTNYIVHFPFKKQGKAFLTIWGNYRGGFGVGSEHEVLLSRDTTEASGPLNSRMTVFKVDMGMWEGEYNAERIRSGVWFAVPMILPDLFKFSLYGGEIGEQLYTDVGPQGDDVIEKEKQVAELTTARKNVGYPVYQNTGEVKNSTQFGLYRP